MQIAAHLPEVRGDPTRMQQIIANILDNAVKFTKVGRISVEVRPYRVYDRQSLDAPEVPRHLKVGNGDWLLIRMQDTGIGIAPDDQQIIFDAFRQVDGSSVREYDGTGLGLAIVRRLLLLHNGHIWVQSEVNQGSSFNILLPVTPDAQTVE